MQRSNKLAYSNLKLRADWNSKKITHGAYKITP